MEKYEEFKYLCLNIGKNIQKTRRKKNISIIEMSMITSINVRYLKKIEKGIAYRFLLNKHLLKIANALDVGIYELLNVED